MEIRKSDGMTVGNSSKEERREVIMKLEGEVSEDAVTYGFYIGELSGKVVADYSGEMCKREINFMEFKNQQK